MWGMLTVERKAPPLSRKGEALYVKILAFKFLYMGVPVLRNQLQAL